MKSQKLFNDFLNIAANENFYKKAIANQSKHFQIKAKQLQKNSPKYVRQQRQYALAKLKENQKKENQEMLEVQKRVLSWILLCFLEKHQITVSELKEKDFKILSQMTTCRPISMIKYFVFSLLKQEKRPKWSQQEDSILKKILFDEKKYDTIGMWSQVSRELFARGQGNSFKTGKQCRERWFNHVDPQLNKHWTLNQELILMQNICENDKQWAKIVPMLNHTKSEHMVKNKYHSLIKKKQNETKQDKEDKLTKMIIKDLRQNIQRLKKQMQIEQKKKQKEIKVKNSDSIKSDPGTMMTRRASSIQKQIEKGQMVLLNSQVIPPSSGISKQKDELNWFQPTHLFRQEPANEMMMVNQTPCTDFKLNQSIRFGYASPIPPSPFNFASHFKNVSKDFVAKIQEK